MIEEASFRVKIILSNCRSLSLRRHLEIFYLLCKHLYTYSFFLSIYVVYHSDEIPYLALQQDTFKCLEDNEVTRTKLITKLSVTDLPEQN